MSDGIRQSRVVLMGILAVAVISLASMPTSEVLAAGNLYEIRLPGMAWSIALELPGFMVVKKGTSRDKSSAMMRAENVSTGVVISIFLDRERKPLNSSECRDKYWKKALRSPAQKTGVESSRIGQIAVGEYMIESFGGQQMMQKHVNAYMGVDNVCVDIHLSKIQYTDEDARLFSAILDSVQVKR